MITDLEVVDLASPNVASTDSILFEDESPTPPEPVSDSENENLTEINGSTLAYGEDESACLSDHPSVAPPVETENDNFVESGMNDVALAHGNAERDSLLGQSTIAPPVCSSSMIAYFGGRLASGAVCFELRSPNSGREGTAGSRIGNASTNVPSFSSQKPKGG